ncbi:MAG: hypothetical protein QNK23_12650 [Crocinitomicaceae bacterium]|nr:hypothetical protein [Crocinitomicaceae bacterium]
MKKIIGIIVLCLAGNIYAQQRETVYSVIVEMHEVSWYKTQMELWKAEIDKDNQNVEAWWNYYAASRGIKNVAYPDEELRSEYFYKCQEIANEAIAAIPETFEGHYLKYWDTGLGDQKYDHLLKAHEINPNDSRAFADLMIYYEVQGMTEEMKDIAERIYELNEMPASMLNWAYNLLSEVDENSIIFSVGDNDTYALWLIQQAKNYRTDVTVVNTSLIRLDSYRTMILTNLGLEDYKLEENEENEESMTGLLNHFFKNTNDHPVYVSASGIRQFQDSIWRENLYLTGLGYKYSETSFDNASVIRKNYEKVFLTDHLYQTFSHNVGDLSTRQKYMYLPSLVKLYKLYKVSGEEQKMNTTLELIIKIHKELDYELDLENLNEGC